MPPSAKQYLIDRLKEPSTWRGLVACLTAFGVALSPEQIAAIVPIGLFVAGLLGAAVPDKAPSPS